MLLFGGELFIHWGSLVSFDVLKLYKIHYFAFPLGVLAAWAFSTTTANKVRQYLNTHIDKSTSKKPKSPIGGLLNHARHYLLMFALMITIGYLSVHSGVGQSPYKEQFVSLCTMALIILLFIVKKIEFRFLSLFGLFSYAIYLFHWPLLSRYDVLYHHMPAWLATLTWLGIFIMLGWLLSVVSGNFMRSESKEM